jgi:adenine-specific DNA-methyltransferase
MTAQEGHATKEQFYEIVAPGGAVHRPPKGRCWGIAKATFERLRAEGRIWFGKYGNSQPNIIRYLSEVEGVVPWTWWPSEEVGHTDEAKKEIHALFGREDAFDTPKPERLMRRVIEIATNPGDLVLDSFAGSGTTGAVAHKMSRRWIMVELGAHCHTHIASRLKKVIEGEDTGGITEAVGWKSGGGFRYYRLAPSLIEYDRFSQPVISPKYDANMLSAAMCKHMGFTYAPSQDPREYWRHGHSSERDFIFVTTASLTYEALKALSEAVGEERTLLICCKAFRAKSDAFPNLTIKEIPQSVLNNCEWGRDDYSLKIAQLPEATGDDEPDDGGDNGGGEPPAHRQGRLRNGSPEQHVGATAQPAVAVADVTAPRATKKGRPSKPAIKTALGKSNGRRKAVNGKAAAVSRSGHGRRDDNRQGRLL